MALVALINGERPFIRSAFNLPQSITADLLLPQRFCADADAGDAPLTIDDTGSDFRCQSHPAVAQGIIKAYAAMPLRTFEGHALGFLCVLDGAPRTWEERQVLLLKELARLVVTEIDLLTLGRQYERLLQGADIEASRSRRLEAALADERGRHARSLRDTTQPLSLRIQQLGGLASRLVHAETRERRRLAETLHDQLQQQLAGVKFRLDAVRAHTPDAAARLSQSIELIEHALSSLHSITTQLSPPALHELGLRPAFDGLARYAADRHGLCMEVIYRGDEPDIGEDLSGLLFRIVQELLLKLVRHAHVNKAAVVFDTRESGRLRISVEDTSVSCDPDSWPDAVGAGELGWAGIKDRLACLGGELTISSPADNGTRIALVVPLEPVAPRGLQQPTDIEQPPARGSAPAIRVMLVDDHTIVREGLRGIMAEERDLEVVAEADNGAEAIDLARHTQPDVIVMDINMPVMDGIEATRRIVAEFPNIRVIGLSFHDREDIASAMRRAGACDYVNKDAAAETLCDSIRQVACR